MNYLYSFWSLALGAIAIPFASAQVPLHSFHGDDSFDEMGRSVALAGDVNGDGCPDVIGGASRDETNGNNAGLARVWSGADGAILWTFLGAASDDYFGRTVGGAGDVNNDGFDDLIVGARYHSASGPDSRNAYVYSGLDGSLIYILEGSPDDNFNIGDVTGVGDLDGDLHDDFLVAEPNDDTNGLGAGRVRAYSGIDGSVLFEFLGAGIGRSLGESADCAGDVNNDGTPDLILGGEGSSTHGFVGRATVHSGLDGSVIHTFDGATEVDGFGTTVSSAGDVNNDGFDDVIIGAPFDITAGSLAGLARVYSGATGLPLHTLTGSNTIWRLGTFVSEAGDYDGDGFDDVLVGTVSAPGTPSGTAAAYLYSGADGSVLRQIRSFIPGDQFGRTGALIGDLNTDGVPDYAFGAILADINGSASGAVYVLSVAPPFTYYCPATANSTGFPANLTAIGHGSNVDNDFELVVDDLPPGGSGLFFRGRTEIQVPFGDGFRCIGGFLQRLQPLETASASGVLSRAIDLNAGGNNPYDPFTTWKFQYWYRDPAAGGAGSNMSNAVSVEFQR